MEKGGGQFTRMGKRDGVRAKAALVLCPTKASKAWSLEPLRKEERNSQLQLHFFTSRQFLSPNFHGLNGLEVLLLIWYVLLTRGTARASCTPFITKKM
ncbi:hypothetical protein SAY87_009776 [Trapa incisa]|uniref:Uncharacterized protein n=1 Tax=Trapa incisa TaxID=236973 RepID=A0AAN7PYK2_9MYRT|nr:hypothetical protein SAY87_009776 [Trapa incisa]